MGRYTVSIEYVIQVLLGRVKAGRSLSVFPDDVFIVSYPRSGNTWARFLIGNLVSPDEALTFGNIESKVPEIYHFSDRDLRARPRPRILKSHEYFDPRYPKVVYIVRDPRDVAVSYFHFHVKIRRIEERYPIGDYIRRFVRGELDPYGSWGDNVASWLGTRLNDPSFLLLRYEDLLEQSTRELAKVASFLNVEASSRRLSHAIALSSADRMRELEKAESKVWQTTRKTRQDKLFVGKAATGGWRLELLEGSAGEIEAAWAPLMRMLGYELVTAAGQASSLNRCGLTETTLSADGRGGR